MSDVPLQIGMLCKLKKIEGDYRGRIKAVDEDGSLRFEDHPDIPYAAESYEPDMADSQTRSLVERVAVLRVALERCVTELRVGGQRQKECVRALSELESGDLGAAAWTAYIACIDVTSPSLRALKEVARPMVPARLR